MAIDAPLVVVAVLEGDEGVLEIFECVEAMEPEELLLEGSDEALGTAVALGLTHVGRAGGDAEEAELGLEEVADEGAPVIVAKGQTGGNGSAVAAKGGEDTLAKGLDSFEASAVEGCVETEALGSGVIDGDEDGYGSFEACKGRGGVDAPGPVRKFV